MVKKETGEKGRLRRLTNKKSGKKRLSGEVPISQKQPIEYQLIDQRSEKLGREAWSERNWIISKTRAALKRTRKRVGEIRICQSAKSPSEGKVKGWKDESGGQGDGGNKRGLAEWGPGGNSRTGEVRIT